MDNKFDTSEIEESLRICEEIFQNNPDFNRRAPRPVEAITLSKNINANKTAEKMESMSSSHSKIQESSVKPEPIEVPEEFPISEETPEPEKESELIDPPEPEKEPELIDPPEPEKEPEQNEISELEEEITKTKKSNYKKNLFAFGICIVVAILIALFITNFIASHTKVEGSSMEDTLANGDDIIVEKFSYLTGDPERYDIVVFHQRESVNYIKRVIALPGETIQITEGKIYINERAIFDAYGNTKMKDGGIAEKPIKLGENEYFVLGDNRNASKDSRDKSVGVIKRDKIIGKAWLRVLPFDNFGEIK